MNEQEIETHITRLFQRWLLTPDSPAFPNAANTYYCKDFARFAMAAEREEIERLSKLLAGAYKEIEAINKQGKT